MNNALPKKTEDIDELLTLLSTPRSQDGGKTAVQQFSPVAVSGSDASRAFSPSLQHFLDENTLSNKTEVTFDFENDSPNSKKALSSSALKFLSNKDPQVEHEATKISVFDPNESDSDMDTELDVSEDIMREPQSKPTLINALPNISITSPGGSSSGIIASTSCSSPQHTKSPAVINRKLYTGDGTDSSTEAALSPMLVNLSSLPSCTKSPESTEKKYVPDETDSSNGTRIYCYKSKTRDFVESSFDNTLNTSADDDTTAFSNAEFQIYSSEMPKISNSSNGGSKSRCSRVVLAGSAVERGLKASLFSKW